LRGPGIKWKYSYWKKVGRVNTDPDFAIFMDFVWPLFQVLRRKDLPTHAPPILPLVVRLSRFHSK
jgi:hypothetical protein